MMTRQRAVGIADVDGPVAMYLDAFLRPSGWLGFACPRVIEHHHIGLAGGRYGAWIGYDPRLNLRALAGLIDDRVRRQIQARGLARLQ